jgi:hypothetical protein
MGRRSRCADFHLTQNLAINISGYPCRPAEFYRNLTKNVENTCTFFLKILVNNIYRCTGFSKTHISAQRHYVDIFRTEFHPSLSRSVKSAGWNSFNLLSNVWEVTQPIFTKFALTAHLVVKDFYTEFDEIPTNDLVADAGSRVVRQADGLSDVVFTYCVLFAFLVTWQCLNGFLPTHQSLETCVLLYLDVTLEWR